MYKYETKPHCKQNYTLKQNAKERYEIRREILNDQFFDLRIQI